MAYEMREGSGILFKNSYKTSSKHPDLTGKALINGSEVDVAGWKKVSQKSGDTFFSLKFTNKDVEGEEKVPF